MKMLPNPNGDDDPLVRRVDVASALDGVAERTLERWFDTDDLVQRGKYACVPLSVAVRVAAEHGHVLDVDTISEDDHPSASVVSLPGRTGGNPSSGGLRGVPSSSDGADQLVDLVASQAERAEAAEDEVSRLRSEVAALKARLARHGLLGDDERG